MNRVLEDIREDTESLRKYDSSQPNGTVGKTGSGGGNGNSKGKGENGQSLALPKNVVEEGVRITRECLELVCEVE